MEATAVGAATIAGVAVGVATLEDLAASWEADVAFQPSAAPALDAAYVAWLDAVRRSRALGAQAARST